MTRESSSSKESYRSDDEREEVNNTTIIINITVAEGEEFSGKRTRGSALPSASRSDLKTEAKQKE